jgi:hypothetical protein
MIWLTATLTNRVDHRRSSIAVIRRPRNSKAVVGAAMILHRLPNISSSEAMAKIYKKKRGRFVRLSNRPKTHLETGILLIGYHLTDSNAALFGLFQVSQNRALHLATWGFRYHELW